MDSVAQVGDKFYKEYGELHSLVGVIRAANVF